MTDRVEFFIAENPRSSDWKLDLPAVCGVCSLLGWRVRPEPVDSGVPPPVAAMLCRVLCDSATVSFISGDSSAPPFSLVSTNTPAIASGLFEEAKYPWTQQGQMVLLSARGASPPNLSPREVRAVMERDPEIAQQAGFMGALLPGVDGDVAGLWVFDAAAKQSLIDAMRTQCAAAGWHFEVLAEDEFREKLSG
jgi:hypothetical protein